MRYLLHSSQLSELTGRQAYLYDIFHLYFLPGQPEGSYIPLTPVGTTKPSILFITGHTDQVDEYLRQTLSYIPESKIVITSCFTSNFKKYASKKEIYVPASQQDFCLLRNGMPYGFDFNISDPELNFYNATGDIMIRVQAAYSRLR